MKRLGKFGRTSVRSKRFHTWPAGDNQKVKLLLGNVRERRIGAKRNLAASGDELLAAH